MRETRNRNRNRDAAGGLRHHIAVAGGRVAEQAHAARDAVDQAMDHTGLRLELAAAPADHEDDVAKASRRLSRRAYDMTSLLADGAAGAGDWELFDLADEARSAAVALLRALDGDA